MRALAVIAACLVLCARAAAADAVDASVRELDAGNYKVRLAAALSLSKSRDPRAVIALATALRNDGEQSIRRVPGLPMVGRRYGQKRQSAGKQRQVNDGLPAWPQPS